MGTVGIIVYSFVSNNYSFNSFSSNGIYSYLDIELKLVLIGFIVAVLDWFKFEKKFNDDNGDIE